MSTTTATPNWARSYSERAGYVYFISGGEEVKIGFSAIPHSRIGALQGSSPKPLELIAIFPGTEADEAALHAWCRAARLHGEWFTFNQSVRDLIADLETIRENLKSGDLTIERYLLRKKEAAEKALIAGGLPRTCRRFEGWLRKQLDLPAPIYALGRDYAQCLNVIALNKNNPEAHEAAKRINADRMAEFITVYADWSVTEALRERLTVMNG